jgi:hypothetical protein
MDRSLGATLDTTPCQKRFLLTFVRRRLGPGYRDVKVPEVVVFRSSRDTGRRIRHEALGLLTCVSGTGRWARAGVGGGEWRWRVEVYKL